MDSRGWVGITAYDHNDGATESVRVSDELDWTDDHSSPAIHVRDDDRLIVYWTDRGEGTENMDYAISENALDISSWGSTQSFTSADVENVDYPQPVPWDGELRLYYRVGGHIDGKWKYRVSTDGGETYGSEQDFVDLVSEAIYIHPYQHEDRLHFALGDHRMDTPAIRHWYLEGGDYHESDGTVIQSGDQELTDETELTLVYDGEASGNNPPKQYDLICDGAGRPHVAFTEHVETGEGGGDGDYRARWAKWDGSEWVIGSEIVEMGGSLPEEHYYEGGLSLDSQDPTRVYASVETDNRNYQIQEWSTDDDGESWSSKDLSPADESVTRPTKRGRPISPRGHQNDLPVIWWAGRYDHFNYSQGSGYDTKVQRQDTPTEYVREGNNWIYTDHS
ncbi:glucosyl hydrolase family protein [Natronorubrum tibetense GA33]|uniref:Glucosyl hydrolase family protein n=2 Tax=Natronorubrum tibetense TaxID=63128 RepID=L9VUE8_9EURY|nr:glucosyl hydrolase family protein [Natronorubrum tibetense GA33]